MRTAPLIVFAAVAVLALAGCGKAGRPLQPADSVYPKIYPNPQAMPATAAQKEGRAIPPEWDQQDLKERFTSTGSYIDPSTKIAPGVQVMPASNLSNTITTPMGSDPLSQSIGSSSVLPPIQASSPADIEDRQ